MEKYQSGCTPQPSISKFPPITPTADKDDFARQGGSFLPPELCLDCIHGYKVLITRFVVLRVSMLISQFDMPNPETGCS